MTTEKVNSGRGADNSKRKVLKEHDSLKDSGQLFVERRALNKNITLIFNFIYIISRNLIHGIIAIMVQSYL